MANSLWIVGTSERIYFWTDNWLGETVVDLIQLDSVFHAHLHGKVSEVIVNGGWHLPAALRYFGDIQSRLNALVLPTIHLPDELVWAHAPDGLLTAKTAVSFLRPAAALLPWADSIWCSVVPPSHSFIFWRLHHKKMPTDDNLRSRGCIVVSVCSLCFPQLNRQIIFFFGVRLLWIFGTG